MKKTMVLGLVAVALLALSHQQASAWHKCNFGVGLNLNSEGGGNSFLWGLFKGAQTPGATDQGYGGYPGGAYDPGPGNLLPAPEPITPKPMPGSKPGIAQPVGYFPYSDLGSGYYAPEPTYMVPSYWR